MKRIKHMIQGNEDLEQLPNIGKLGNKEKVDRNEVDRTSVFNGRLKDMSTPTEGVSIIRLEEILKNLIKDGPRHQEKWTYDVIEEAKTKDGKVCIQVGSTLKNIF